MHYIDIHTHQSGTSKEVISVWNLLIDKDVLVIPTSCFSLSKHPWYINAEDPENTLVSNIIQSPYLIAIGECGLDRLVDTDWSLQIEVFQKQIELANTMQKPLIIHCVRALDECLQQLQSSRTPVVFHGVNISWRKVQLILSKGYFVSIGSALLTSKMIQEYLPKIPLDQLFLETDDHNISIQEIYALAAKVLKTPLETLILQIESNYKSITEF